MRCSCRHEFTPTDETFHGTQLFPSDERAGDVWLYLVLHRCPAQGCGSVRSLVMFCTVPDDDDAADLIDDTEPYFSAERDNREIAAE